MPGDQGQDRTEPASPKKRKEAAEKGQVPRSRELTTVTMLMTGAGGLVLLGDGLVLAMQQVAHSSMALKRREIFDDHALVQKLQSAITPILDALTPFFALLILAALLAPMALGGWSFSVKVLALNWSKLNPISGMKRVFSWRGLMELGKSLVKFVVILIGAVLLLRGLMSAITGLGQEPFMAAMAHFGELLVWGFLALCLPLLFVVAADVPFQLWDHSRRLRMTRQEVKDEQKETDGDPHMRRRVRERQREITQRRMMAQVPKADVVITNPSHFAVALRYEHSSMRAPVVVAKGQDLIALQIRRVGAESHVPIVSSPMLARALYYTTDLDREIPVDLYRAVAQVLAHVFELRETGGHKGGGFIEMSEIELPETLLQRLDKE